MFHFRKGRGISGISFSSIFYIRDALICLSDANCKKKSDLNGLLVNV